MPLNPYATHLGLLDPHTVLAETPNRLQHDVCELTPERIAQPLAPGKWSICQTVAHLADCELVFSFRLRQTLEAAPGEPAPVLQPFDQDRWAAHYAAYTLPEALKLFCAAREWNLKLLKVLTPADYARPVTHPERGTMTFQTILETMAGHDLNHLAQIEAASGS